MQWWNLYESCIHRYILKIWNYNPAGLLSHALTGRKKNLIITPNGENVSPEEIENKLSENRIIQEVLVRESEGVIESEIFTDYEYAAKKKVKDIRSTLQEILDEYNLKAPLYKRVIKLKIRETEFEKNTTKKIKRF